MSELAGILGETASTVCQQAVSLMANDMVGHVSHGTPNCL